VEAAVDELRERHRDIDTACERHLCEKSLVAVEAATDELRERHRDTETACERQRCEDRLAAMETALDELREKHREMACEGHRCEGRLVIVEAAWDDFRERFCAHEAACERCRHQERLAAVENALDELRVSLCALATTCEEQRRQQDALPMGESVDRQLDVPCVQVNSCDLEFGFVKHSSAIGDRMQELETRFQEVVQSQGHHNVALGHRMQEFEGRMEDKERRRAEEQQALEEMGVALNENGQCPFSLDSKNPPKAAVDPQALLLQDLVSESFMLRLQLDATAKECAKRQSAMLDEERARRSAESAKFEARLRSFAQRLDESCRRCHDSLQNHYTDILALTAQLEGVTAEQNQQLSKDLESERSSRAIQYQASEERLKVLERVVDENNKKLADLREDQFADTSKLNERVDKVLRRHIEQMAVSNSLQDVLNERRDLLNVDMLALAERLKALEVRVDKAERDFDRVVARCVDECERSFARALHEKDVFAERVDSATWSCDRRSFDGPPLRTHLLQDFNMSPNVKMERRLKLVSDAQQEQLTDVSSTRGGTESDGTSRAGLLGRALHWQTLDER